jgi:hypothetical protein
MVDLQVKQTQLASYDLAKLKPQKNDHRNYL